MKPQAGPKGGEIIFYFGVYLAALSFSIWEIFKLSNDKLEGYHELSSGWSIIPRRKDDYDFEWTTWQIFLKNNLKYFALHLVGVRTAAAFLPVRKPEYVYAAIGCMCVYFSYGNRPLALLTVNNLMFYAATLTNRKSVVWLISILWICVINYYKPNSLDDEINTFSLTLDEFLEMLTILTWNLLKCISFSIDKIESPNEMTNYRVIDLFAYSFYYPTFYFGPFFVYERFRKILLTAVAGREFQYAKRLEVLFKDLATCVFWFLFAEMSLHFLYVSLLQQNELAVERASSFALYGFGYMMGQFFHLKYICCYGLGIAMGKFDQIEMPNRPICIGRVHLYSDMWKHFDEGLYEFLFKYIYAHICTKTSPHWRKLFASFMTFFFIYIWHGRWMFILLWAAANFVCIVFEYFLKHFYNCDLYKRWVVDTFSETGELRLRAMIGCHVLIPSVLSNFFFFAGTEIGMIFIQCTYFSSIFNYMGIYCICFCIYNIGEWYKAKAKGRSEKRRKE